ncbi:MAG: hypothetical protein A2157_19075 [Deltaproteobacteria bacterium RBG_16_47_11]|nr:MAG: hypothetical protein A2157_19075 [Deltaproteobacteria bacterium RBG_16_47_11]
MKAVVLMEPGRVEIREQKEPVPKEGEVFIKVRAVGVCSSDVHAYRGSHPFVSYPRVLGHEIAGEAERAIQIMEKRCDGVVKVVLTP